MLWSFQVRRKGTQPYIYTVAILPITLFYFYHSTYYHLIFFFLICLLAISSKQDANSKKTGTLLSYLTHFPSTWNNTAHGRLSMPVD